MVNINIEIKENVHKNLKINAAKNEQTLKDHIIEILERIKK